MKKNMLIMFFIFALLICKFVWWFDIGSWCSLPIELCYTHASDFSFRDKNNNKAEADMYTWRTFFHPDDFVSSEEKLIYNQYNSLVGFDFSQYTYILSYGFSIEYLYCKQPDAKKMQYGKVVHDVNCLPNEVLLYRVPRVYIEPNPDRTDSFSYKFIHSAP